MKGGAEAVMIDMHHMREVEVFYQNDKEGEMKCDDWPEIIEHIMAHRC